MPYPRRWSARPSGDGKPSPYRRIMVYDPRLHHRRSIRLRGYDYAGGGAYFITICSEAKKCLFGEIIEGEMFLNEAGRLVQKTWDSLPGRFRTLVLDAFQIMPNHLHGVFVLPGPGLEPALAKATGAPVIQPYEDRRGRACPTLVGDHTHELWFTIPTYIIDGPFVCAGMIMPGAVPISSPSVPRPRIVCSAKSSRGRCF